MSNLFHNLFTFIRDASSSATILPRRAIISNSTELFSNNFTLYDMDDDTLTIPRLVISLLFLVTFFTLIGVVAVFVYTISRGKEVLRPNQKWMIGLLTVLLVFQTIALSSRVVSTSLYYDTNGKLVDFIQNQVQAMNQTSDRTQFMLDEVFTYRNSSFTTQQAGISYGNVVGIYLTTSIDLFFTLSNLLIIVVIMCFVANVFLTTVRKTNGSFSSSHTKHIVRLFNASTTILSIGFFVEVLIIAFCIMFINLRAVEDFQLPLYVVCYVFYLLQIIIQVVVSTVTAVRVLLLIHNASMDHKIASRPFIRVILLQGGLILCAMLQIVAMGCGALSPEWEYLGLFYDVLNSLGILLFASLAMGIYTPIFTSIKLSLKQTQQNAKDYMSTANHHGRSVNGQVSSPRGVSNQVSLGRAELVGEASVSSMESSPSV